jgi:DNA-directed RNA polymerase subunit beta'
MLKNAEGESLQRLDFDRRIFKYFRYLFLLTTSILMILIQINLLPKWEQSVLDLLARMILMIVLQLRHNANNETSKQRKTEALKDYKLLNLSVSLT